MHLFSEELINNVYLSSNKNINNNNNNKNTQIYNVQITLKTNTVEIPNLHDKYSSNINLQINFIKKS